MVVVKIKVNDEEIELNEIMENIVSNIIDGFLEALHGIPDKREKINVDITF